MALVRGLRIVVVAVGLFLVPLGCSSPGPAETSPKGSGGLASGTGGGASATGGTNATGGSTGGAGSGGQLGTGGTNATGGSRAGGGATSTGGAAATGGAAGAASTGGARTAGGTSGNGGATGGGGGGTSVATGGAGPAGGAQSGGATATGGARPAGGSTGTGGGNGAGGVIATGGSTTTATGGGSGSGGATGNGGAIGTGGSTGGAGCSITITSSAPSPKMATVGVVEWSTTLANLTSAQIVWTLNNAGASILNKGGIAPVDLTKANYHTLLLGLKPSSTYTFHVEATAGGTTCKSDDKTLTTGTLTGAPTVTRTATTPSAQAKGFIIATPGVAGMGSSGGTQAYIIDADGTVVWTAAAPASCSRARLDYEGNNLWMMALNVMNSGGEMRYVSLDGATTQTNVSGLSKSHHDFTVRKGGIITTMVWSTSGSDPESDLVERGASGTVSTVFHIGTNLYKGGASVLGGGSNSFHCNSVLYHETDDSYTIGDRNPNLYVKVTHAGAAVWQFGGNCSGAPAPKCVAGSWTSNHGHHLLDDGTFLFFSNGTFNSSSTPSYAYEYTLSTSGTMSATQVKAYKSANNSHSDSLGDVQRLPNGNTLVTFSNGGLIQEVDSSWNVVQTLSAGSFGYSEWRETLYGPPPR